MFELARRSTARGNQIKRTRYIRPIELDHSIKALHDLPFTQNFELEKERESEVRVSPEFSPVDFQNSTLQVF